MNPNVSWRIFRWAMLVEGSLAGVAALLACIFRHPLTNGFSWRLPDLLWGLAAALPMLPCFGWVLKSPSAPATSIRLFLEHHVRPLFTGWSLGQLAALSLVAGLSEELLFRGVIQGILASHTHPVIALMLASGLFGAAHAVTRSYACLAAVIGVYLGALWMWRGNLLAPFAAHALYDFIALAWFLRKASSHSDSPA